MNDHDPTAAAFAALLLEERLGGQPPPDLCARVAAAARAPADVQRVLLDEAPSRGSHSFAAVFVAAGLAVVAGVAAFAHQAAVGPLPAAAAPQDGAQAMAAARYFPIAAGSQWTYRETRGSQETRVEVEIGLVVLLGGAELAQRIERRGDRHSVTFWSSGKEGIHRHASASIVEDPKYRAEDATVGGGHEIALVLPSPLGSAKSWSWLEPEQSSLDWSVGEPTEIERRATLVGVAETVRIGDRQWECVHVRVDIDVEGGKREEHWFLASGTGLVRRTVRRDNGPETVLELEGFTPARPAADRSRVLATAAGRATGVKWLVLPPTLDAAWVVRSAFATLEVDGEPQIWRVWDERALRFDPARLDDWVAFANDERFAQHFTGLMPQRRGQGLAEIAARLHASLRGTDTGERLETTAEIDPDPPAKATITQEWRWRGGGEAKTTQVEAVLEGGVPKKVTVTPK